ncbi:MAG: response regulator [Halobacteriales archaeon]|nr:response regulator [Halobacteriales archaeon]
MRVLIVNDDPDIAESLHSVIEQQFPRVFVTVALSGRAALQLLEDDATYAVVLCDPLVRGMQAKTFLAEARRIAPQAAHVVIAGASPDAARRLAAEVGADALLVKPFDMASLEQTLALLLPEVPTGRHPSERPPAAP